MRVSAFTTSLSLALRRPSRTLQFSCSSPASLSSLSTSLRRCSSARLRHSPTSCTSADRAACCCCSACSPTRVRCANCRCSRSVDALCAPCTSSEYCSCASSAPTVSAFTVSCRAATSALPLLSNASREASSETRSALRPPTSPPRVSVLFSAICRASVCCSIVRVWAADVSLSRLRRRCSML
ncbi:hypothetical protein B484DRAFT_255040 [Ochromonadaceae sp. CCMP2298]|nr:hypothetical protein B484DRAFT_255040 [Ochromonadaceae sp. CCMP2298]